MEKVEQPNDIVVSAKCGPCGRVDSVAIKDTAWNRFELRQGLAQNLFPTLTDQERELVMQARNGGKYLCESCWAEVFADSVGELDAAEAELDERERASFEAVPPRERKRK